jgi:hypothetical protein
MTFDWTFTVGNLITIVSVVGGIWATAMKVYYLLAQRLDRLEGRLLVHTETLASHASRMVLHEDRFLKAAGDLQHVIGRMDSRNGQERRGGGA